MFALLKILIGPILNWIIGKEFGKHDYEQDKINEDERLLQQVKEANDMADRIRNDPNERKRVYDALNRDK